MPWQSQIESRRVELLMDGQLVDGQTGLWAVQDVLWHRWLCCHLTRAQQQHMLQVLVSHFGLNNSRGVKLLRLCRVWRRICCQLPVASCQLPVASGCYQLPLLLSVPTSCDSGPAACQTLPFYPCRTSSPSAWVASAFVSVSSPPPRPLFVAVWLPAKGSGTKNRISRADWFDLALQFHAVLLQSGCNCRAGPGLREEPQPELPKNSNFQLWSERNKKSEPKFSFSDELSAKTDSARFSMSEQTLSPASPAWSCLALALSSARETAWPIPTSGQTGIRCSGRGGWEVEREGGGGECALSVTGHRLVFWLHCFTLACLVFSNGL